MGALPSHGVGRLFVIEKEKVANRNLPRGFWPGGVVLSNLPPKPGTNPWKNGDLSPRADPPDLP